jgi:hypothetical protein
MKNDQLTPRLGQVEARCESIHNWRNLQSQGPDSQGEFVRQFQRSHNTMEAAAGAGGKGGASAAHITSKNATRRSFHAC